MRIIYQILPFFLTVTMAANILQAQEIIEPKIPIRNRSFAIIVDSESFKQCKNDIIAYQHILEKEGLPSFIIHHTWKNPDEVKKQILKLYQEQKLEGIVLIGDIPIPMVRKAQHLATAFKMDESYPIRDSSVPSDRFYDDFDLKFDYLKQDEKSKLLHYYDLAIDADNKIHSDIYSGRIKPISLKDKNPYTQISLYLRKAVRAHEQRNPIDKVIAYLGDGTLSNSLSAWTPELFRLEEQFPNVFKTTSQAQVFRYDSWDFPKNEIIDQLRRKDLDIAFFHEHGLPERQYLSGEIATKSSTEHFEAIQYKLKELALQQVKGDKTADSFFKKYEDKYYLSPAMIRGYNSQEFKDEDSLQTVKKGINVEEVDAIQPNAKFIIFDACFNGDIREDDYIAGRFIFAEGESVAALANTVSILQDVNTPHLIGTLGMGLSIGRWAQMNHVLESHVIGDPTFTFAANYNENVADILKAKSTDTLLAQFDQTTNTEIKSLILMQLYTLKYPGLSALIQKEYDQSRFTTIRYTCLYLGTLLDKETRLLMLKKGSQDADEFIRRHSLNVMSHVGDPELIEPIVQAYIDNQHAARILFSVKMSLYSFNQQDIRKAADSLFEKASFRNKEEVKALFFKDQFQGFYADINKDIFDKNSKYRKLAISALKNVNYHPGVPEYLKFVRDKDETEGLRIAMLQSLAWFGKSYQKQDIQQACLSLIADHNNSSAIRNEAQRTFNTIK